MTGQQTAIVDLGTNTFHILVVRAEPSGWKQLYRERIFVNLAEEGIAHIGKAAWYRALTALNHYAGVMRELQVDNTIAIATAALRTADNALAFIREVAAQTGIHVEVIPGRREAELITRGVWEAIPRLAVPGLIMDIGGGSVEFVLGDPTTTLFSKSYPAGVAVLYEKFHHSEPMSTDEFDALDKYLSALLSELLLVLKEYPDAVLVGASGTFEIVDQVMHPDEDQLTFSTFDRDSFDLLYRDIRVLNLEQRLEHPGIPETRARYIVVALHLIAFILRHLKQSSGYISLYAMKEGVAAEWYDNLDRAKNIF